MKLASYASKVWYIWGDVQITGRYPFTGNETFLDALSYAGGFLPTADPSRIRIIRPGLSGKKTLILDVDYNAVLHGDAEQNYQIFPGDRLIVPAKAGE